jgi:NAD(P)-dependent dehydrogenase (short-subunit alcohol dehydrogenase family)
MSHDSRVALVTGASRGIGRAVATRLARTGYRVAVASRSEQEIGEVADELGAHPLTLDVADDAAVAAAIAAVERDVGSISLLVNNAGSAGDGVFAWEQAPGRWWDVFEINVLGTFLCCHAVLPHMRSRGHGRIVNLGSNAAFFRVQGDPDPRISSAYMASKAAVIRLSESLAGELRGDGVQVFAISPGTVRTEMTAPIFVQAWDDEDIWSPPELTADLIEFLETGALDALSGRYIHAANDDWRAFPARIPALLADDALALRVR